MKKGISKTRRFIESFALIGFFILFITLAVGQAGSKVGADAQVPMQTGDQLNSMSSTRTLSDYTNCTCLDIYDETAMQTLGNWLYNKTQLPLTMLEELPPDGDRVMDVPVNVKDEDNNTYELILRISNAGKIALVEDSGLSPYICRGSWWPYCCFNYQRICCTLKWLFPWIHFDCSYSFWRCLIKGNCYVNYYYYNWFFWILCGFFWCC